MEEWDQETLEKVVESKRKEYNMNKPTDIVSFFSKVCNLCSSSQLSTCLLIKDLQTLDELRNFRSLAFGCVQVCKYFLEAVEKKQYGWFWVCPNGGKDCHYRHALPPGYVLKSQMKALLEEEAEKVKRYPLRRRLKIRLFKQAFPSSFL